MLRIKKNTIIFPGSKQISQKSTSASKKLGKSLPKYLILQGCSEFVLSIKIQSIQISNAKRQIFNKIPNFVKVAPPSTVQFFFLAEVVLSRKPQSPTQKHTSKHIFYMIAPGGCFLIKFRKFHRKTCVVVSF